MPATQTEVTAARLATMTGGHLVLEDLVALRRGRNSVRLSVGTTGITMRVNGQVFEDFAADTTIEQIAAHALAVAAVTEDVRPLPGSIVTGPWCGQKAA